METDEAFNTRLCKVIAAADTHIFKTPFAWQVLPVGHAPSAAAIACVRDGEKWHEFVPVDATHPVQEQFVVVRFRFAETGPSAIGFVAWLHSHLRVMGQTGAIVICGKDQRHASALFEICQGVMDYWACPVGPTGDRFLNVIQTLIKQGQIQL